jgi:hypothetical protein
MAFQYAHSRRAAFLAAGLAAVATLSGLTAADGRGTMAAAFAALAVGFAGCSRITAMMAAAIALSISASQGMWTLALTAVVCAIVAAVAARAARLAPVGVRRKLIPIAAVVFVGAICWMTPAVEADGPFQYEAAARMCRRIAGEFARNTWLVVSPTQELPFVYGQGWHLELTEFLASFSREQVMEASFRFPYPVRDIFFFVEREPLTPVGSRVGERLEYVTHSPDPAVVAYSTALGRTGLQFAAGQLLAEYAKSHGDLKLVYFGERLCVYRAPGALAESR